MNKITTDGNKQVFGIVEKVLLLDKNISIDAKIDTGASMSSLSAIHIETFKIKNNEWVKFTINTSNPNKKMTLIKPLIDTINILNREAENKGKTTNIKHYNVRPVIILAICIGNQKKNIFVNLTNREHFRYPMLIGADALKEFNALVDVSQRHLNLPACI